MLGGALGEMDEKRGGGSVKGERCCVGPRISKCSSFVRFGGFCIKPVGRLRTESQGVCSEENEVRGGYRDPR